MKKKISFQRLLSYTFGMMILAVGLTLTAETGLGTSPLTSIAYVLSAIFHRSFPDMTLVMFCLFVVGEIALEQTRSVQRIAALLLQIPVSLLFTRVMHLVQRMIDISQCSLPVRFLCLLAAIVLTGVGAAMTLRANLIPNPGDGIVRAIATRADKPLGTVKNVFDISNVLVAGALSLGVLHSFVGVGVGSVLAMLGVGRVIAAYTAMWRRFQR